MIATRVARPDHPIRTVRNRRLLILAVALPALVVKLIMAAQTYGTNDIVHWLDFAQAVKRVGPIRVYGFHFLHSLYNHPPLMGYFLVAVNSLTHFGLSVKFSIRATASLADVASALLLFEVLRRRRALWEATAASLLIAASPVLFSVSGFHGNTDPLFTMLTLLSLYLLADRQMPALAGVALATALSVKIVPLVVVPSLLLYAASKGRRTLLRFAGALVAVVIVIWTPAVLSEWTPIRHNVLGYTGSPAHPWGLPQFAQWAGLSGLSHWLGNSGRIAVVVCGVLPALVVWRRPQLVAEATGLAMVGFLLLSPAFGVQYLVWPLLFCYLISFWEATAYNLLAGALLVKIYTRWSGTFLWYHAHATLLTARERKLAAVVWVALALAAGRGLWRLRPGAWTARPDAEILTPADSR